MWGKTIVVLAGTKPHAELIKNLKIRGYRTVLVDYTENPVAKAYADYHYVESTMDFDAVERIARDEHAIQIMDICIDRPIPIAAGVAEKLGLSHPISYGTSLIATNKKLMKKFMMENEILTSRYMSVSKLSDIDEQKLSYPLIVKPSDASGSIGIARVDKSSNLFEAVEYALSKSRNGEAIIEEYIAGKEIQIDCFIENGTAKILDIKSKRMITDRTFSLPYGSIIPAGLSDYVTDEINVLCNRLVRCLDIKNGPLYIQAIVKDEQVFVIEFGIRFGGGLSFKITKDVAGIDIIDATVEAYLGGQPHIQSHFDDFDGVYATYHMFPQRGVFSEVTGYEKLLEQGFFEYFAVNMNRGHSCTGNLTSSERVGAFILRAKDNAELNEKLRLVIDTIDIIGDDGNSIMRKDIYCV